MTARRAALEAGLRTVLRWGIYTGIGLVLLTPFVVTTQTAFPFVVGKALWSRSAIEIVFALWAVLALLDPAWRPPRSRILALLAAGLGVSLLAALAGVGVQRSLWSDYERMQGVVDLAHWFAFTLVLVSVLRSPAAWRRLLAASALAGTAMACIAIARDIPLEIPFYGALPERHAPRLGGPLGNPIFLSGYLLANLALALGFAIRSWVRVEAAPVPAADLPSGGRRAKRRGEVGQAEPRRQDASRLHGLLWLCAAALQLWGMVLAGSTGGFVGLLGGAGFLALAFALFVRDRRRWIAVAALALLCFAATGAGLRAVDPDRTGGLSVVNSVMNYVVGMHLQHPGVQTRFAAWRAGLEGFAQRPLLGWGPGNFGTVFGRFATGHGAVAKPHDQAHSKLVDVAATTGAVGVLAYLALWAYCLLVLWRAARPSPPRDRALLAFAGTALAAVFVNSQFLFDTAAGSLVIAVLFGFVAGLEKAAFPDSDRGCAAARLRQACAAVLRRRGVRAALGAGALAAAAAGLAANLAILAAADNRHMPRAMRDVAAFAGGIEAFPPLASTHRGWLFGALTRHWVAYRERDPAAARRLLAWAEREAEAVRRTEPERWRLHHGLAAMYRAVAATEPEYRAKARAALERARALTPNRAVFPGRLEAPVAVEARRLEDGRHSLRWRGSPGAGYHVVAQVLAGGGWRALLHAYDAGRTSWVGPRRPPPGVYRYRIKACRHHKDCSAWIDWLPVTEPPGAAGSGRR